MEHNKLALYVHLVWTTWDRTPLLNPELERAIHCFLHHKAESCGCEVIALDGTEDHIHLLVKMSPTLSVSDLVQKLKGSSAYFANHTLEAREPLKWRASYAAFSVSRWDLRKISNYINNQKEHHARKSTIEEFESGASD